MITISILFTLLFIYSIYDIKVKSGSWSKFDPFNTNAFFFVIFVYGFVFTIVILISCIAHLISLGIIP